MEQTMTASRNSPGFQSISTGTWASGATTARPSMRSAKARSGTPVLEHVEHQRAAALDERALRTGPPGGARAPHTQPIVQFAGRMHDDTRRERIEGLAFVGTETDRHAVGAGVGGELQIVRGCRRSVCGQPRSRALAISSSSIRGCGLEGGAGGVEQAVQLDRPEYLVEPAARLAGGHTDGHAP